MPPLRKFLAFSALALPAALGGCFGNDDRPVEVLAIGEPSSTFVGGAQLPLAAQQLRAATTEGLVAFDEPMHPNAHLYAPERYEEAVEALWRELGP